MSKFPSGRRQLNATIWPFGDHAGSMRYPLSGKSSSVVLVPSAFIMYSLGMPPRSLTNMTLWPVLGFHVGEVLAPAAKVTRLGRPPFASTTNSSGFPSIEDENIICVPSGDHAGALLEPRKRGKETTLLASIEYMQICGLTTPLAPGAKQVKAMREASGDHLGVSEIVRSEVSEC